MFHHYDSLLSDEEVLAAQLSKMTVDERLALIEELDFGLLRWSWKYTARPDQYAATEDDTHIVGLVGGRGAGKTRTGSEFIRKRVGRGTPTRFALVGRTAGDVRDTMIQGESGLLHVFPPSEEPKYIPSNRILKFYDGSFALCFSAEEPDQLRGPQFHYGWADELAAWDMKPDPSGLTAWDNLLFSTRLEGPQEQQPQVIFTTTPKRIQFLRDLLKEAEESLKVSIYNQASTYDNRHLASVFAEVVTGRYGGTRLALQEIHGKMTDAVEGALWTEDLLKRCRTYDPVGELPLRVVGVDPTTAEEPGDECGIVVVGATPKAGSVYKRTGYILDDRSVYGSPDKWVPEVCKAARDYDATVVAESNQGGELVRGALHSHDPGVRVKLVTAKLSKKLRADPVAQVFDQGRIWLNGRFPELEDQMTSWVPSETKTSPDRIDAMVHAFTGLVTATKIKSASGGSTQVHNPARGKQLSIGPR